MARPCEHLLPARGRAGLVQHNRIRLEPAVDVRDGAIRGTSGQRSAMAADISACSVARARTGCARGERCARGGEGAKAKAERRKGNEGAVVILGKYFKAENTQCKGFRGIRQNSGAGAKLSGDGSAVTAMPRMVRAMLTGFGRRCRLHRGCQRFRKARSGRRRQRRGYQRYRWRRGCQ